MLAPELRRCRVKPRVVVVGLGPAGADLLLPAARAALERVPVRFVRTARHPAVVDLASEGIDLEPLDLLYDRADDLDTVYAAIADRVVETAREQGEIVYAVPGSPTIAERSVELVRAAGIDVELIPGISFVDLAWWRLGIDPMHGARVDRRARVRDRCGRIERPDADRAVRFAARVLRGEARAARIAARPTTRSRCCSASASPTSASSPSRSPISTVTSSPTISRRCSSTPAASRWAPSSPRLLALTERLRGPGGCPWDAKQTHHTLRRHVLEEAYEVVEAIEQLPADAPAGDIPIGAYDALEDELGDLLFQVMIQSVLASEAGAFTVADVARGGAHEARAPAPARVRRRSRERRQRGRDQLGADQEDREGRSVARRRRDGGAAGVDRRAEAVPQGRVDRARARSRSRALGSRAGGGRRADAREAAIGSALAAIAAIGREHDIDAESALASWARRYKDRFRKMEQLAGEAGVDLVAAPAVQVRELWERAEL